VLAAGSRAKLLLRGGLDGKNQGSIELAGGSFDNDGKALVNASQGTVSGWGVWRSGRFTNQGTVFLSGGITALRAASTVLQAGSQLTVAGASNTTVYGAVEIQSGASVAVAEGAMLTFAGRVAQRNGALLSGGGSTVFQGGLAIGNSPGLGRDAGQVTFAASNLYEAEIGGTAIGDSNGNGLAFDRYLVAGKLTFGGTLKLVAYGGFAPQAGQHFDLFDWGSSSGSFASIDTSAAALGDGLRWDLSQLYTTGEVGVLAAAPVPELGSWALLLAGLGLMATLRRTRSQERSRRAGRT
jgi:hypothetical protein